MLSKMKEIPSARFLATLLLIYRIIITVYDI